MRRLRRYRIAVINSAWSMADPIGWACVVYAMYRWQELLGIGLAGAVLIGYGAIRGK